MRSFYLSLLQNRQLVSQSPDLETLRQKLLVNQDC